MGTLHDVGNRGREGEFLRQRGLGVIGKILCIITKSTKRFYSPKKAVKITGRGAGGGGGATPGRLFQARGVLENL